MIQLRNKHHRPISQLCFGTVQLGMAYGIANRTGMPDADEAKHMLDAACKAGITVFDTARAYGQSEARLGENLRYDVTILTKLSAIDDGRDIDAQVEASVQASLQSLNLAALPYLQLHDAAHLHAYDGAVWKRLLAMQQEGLIERLGVSIYSPREALDALAVREVECLQLPYNILDDRWERAGIPQALEKRPDVLVLTRSAVLQGLLLKEPETWPSIPPEQARSITDMLDGWVQQFRRRNRIDLAFAFVRGQSWIDSVIVGMETTQQLYENLEMFQTLPLSADACAMIRKSLPQLPETLLNPALWPKGGR